MSIYVAKIEEISRVVGSCDADLLRHLEEEANEDELEEIAALLDDDYPKDVEDERAPDLIRAFEILCRELCPANTTIEMYDDPERTPLLWEFLWSDPDGAIPLRLPFSYYGTPAVTWHPPGRAVHYRAEFERWRTSGTVDERYMSLLELDDLVTVLGEAVEGGCGVLVFYEGG